MQLYLYLYGVLYIVRAGVTRGKENNAPVCSKTTVNIRHCIAWTDMPVRIKNGMINVL